MRSIWRSVLWLWMCTCAFVDEHGVEGVLGGIEDEAMRVRKSWSRYSGQEKETFRYAVALAMERGLHQAFAATHADMNNYQYAHANCGFLIWHRVFLVAYESMLRSLSDATVNVTLPYWNYFEDFDRVQDGKQRGDEPRGPSAKSRAGVPCDSLVNCAPFLQEMGGITATPGIVDDTFSSALYRGFCAPAWLSTMPCAGPDSSCSTRTGRCLLRGDWNSTSPHVLDALSSNLSQSLAELHDGLEDRHAVSYTIEGRFHNIIHEILAGVMTTLRSPLDPVFYGHHATLDMLYSIYNHCSAQSSSGSDHDSEEESPEIPDDDTRFASFTQCAVPNGSIVTRYSRIPMVVNSTVEPYFRGLSLHSYAWFEDASGLGEMSYKYELDEYMTARLRTAKLQCSWSGSQTPLMLEAKAFD